jgi:hypothetical protein
MNVILIQQDIGSMGREVRALTGEADGDELGAEVAGGGVAAGVGVQVLVVARHYALLRRQEVRVHATAHNRQRNSPCGSRSPSLL